MSEIAPFSPPCPLHTPVLFLVYKRPDTTRQVFEAIRQAKPPRLYVAADGPKKDVPGEAEKVKQVREIILNGVDWDCEVKTLFREENLGCKYGVSGGIDWFFENEEEGIILEDDTLPSQSFFWFCQELLVYYRNNSKIGMISGNNRFENKMNQSDFFFSMHGLIWGWATWKYAWEKRDIHMESYGDKAKLDLFSYIGDKKVTEFWLEKFDKVAYTKFDTWDYQWTYSRYINKFLTIRPKFNLVKNIGFNNEATHTQGKPDKRFVKKNDVNFPLIYPKSIIADGEEDKKLEKEWLNNKNIIKRIIRKLIY
ncbi:MAG: nucleotide-diphospho-sugar transferase [Candidatus Electrothrix sp. AW3_4]|nr:nucleotide-diphospho-sugar transferase [Candidatus Electrothrix gigas]